MLSREEISERAGVKFGDASWETIKIVAPIIEAGASLEVREKIIPYLEDLLMMSQPVMINSLQMLIYSLKQPQPEAICATCPPGTPIDKCQCEHTTAVRE